MRIRLPPDFWLTRAENRTRTAETISRKLFGLAEAESQVEKGFVEKQKEKVLGQFGTGDDELDQQLNETRMDLECDLEDIEEDRNEVGRLCLVYMDYELRSILRFLLQHYANVGRPPGGLSDLAAEYERCFDIRFNDAPLDYEDVQELCLARNDIVHEDSKAGKRYLSTISSPKLLGTTKEILIGRQAFEHCSRVFSQFLKFVISDLAVKKGFKKH